MKIYVIKSTFVNKEEGINNKNVWSNVYAVKTEKDAKRDCIKFQNQANEWYLGSIYKIIYTYEETTLY